MTELVVHSLSCVWLFVTPWTVAHQAPLFFAISQSLLKFMSTEWWCCPTISSSATSFSLCLQSFPVSESLPMSFLFASGGQNIRASASASVLSMNIQDWLVSSPCSPSDSQEPFPTPQYKSSTCFLQHHSSKASILYCPAFFMVLLWYIYMTTGKTVAL